MLIIVINGTRSVRPIVPWMSVCHLNVKLLGTVGTTSHSTNLTFNRLYCHLL